MKIKFRKSFEKDVSKIRDEDLLRTIQAVIEEVENSDSLQNINNIRKLKSRKDYYRIRIGNYRIGLAYRKNVVTFVRVLLWRIVSKSFIAASELF